MTTPQTRETLPNGLPKINRLITAHNQAGKAIYSNAVEEENKWVQIGNRFGFSLAYSTQGFPVDMNASEPDNTQSTSKDIRAYQTALSSPPGLVVTNGTVCRFVDFAPNSEPVMHRTESLDYGVVIEGVMELELDSGEKRVMNRGDLCIQRATNHAWKNISEDDTWARMMFVLIAAEKVVVGGLELGEDIPDVEGMKAKMG